MGNGRTLLEYVSAELGVPAYTKQVKQSGAKLTSELLKNLPTNEIEDAKLVSLRAELSKHGITFQDPRKILQGVSLLGKALESGMKIGLEPISLHLQLGRTTLSQALVRMKDVKYEDGGTLLEYVSAELGVLAYTGFKDTPTGVKSKVPADFTADFSAVEEKKAAIRHALKASGAVVPSGENLDKTLKALVILAKAKNDGVTMTDKDAMSRVGATRIGERVANWRSVARKDDPQGRSVLKYICDELGIPENTTVGAKTDASAYTELPSTFVLPDLSMVQAKKSAIMTVLKANRPHGVSVPHNLENLEKSLTALVYLDSASRQSFPSNVEPAAIAKAGVPRRLSERRW